MKKTFYFLICFIAFISFSNQTFSQTAADSANVTFQVDMSTVSSSFQSLKLMVLLIIGVEIVGQ